jgi:hypothetical protein
MDSESKPKSIRSWLLTVVLLMAILGLFIAIAIPNFVGGGPSKLSSVINMLRQIDGAKAYWALQHGLTNNVVSFRELTQKDIAALFIHGDNQDHIDRFGFGFDKNGYIKSGDGVVFQINPLGVSPEAIFLRVFKQAPIPLPEGSIMKLDENGMEEYIVAGQPPKIYRWINQEFKLVSN